MKCLYCGKQNIGSRRYCNISCYSKWYYREHIDEKRKYYAENYIPHPRKLTEKQKLERIEHRKQVARDYYNNHKEYYKIKSHARYIAFKDDIKDRERRRKNMRAYYYRRKAKLLELEGVK